ncbi:MAG: trypsin-like serine protease [Pirellulaceae bacterium]
MTIRKYEAKRHDRFYEGKDKSFVGEAFDWSGVGKTRNAWVTMISPSYFLSAAHLAPDANDEVTFFRGNDRAARHVYTVAGGQRITIDNTPTDLWIGKLTAPLDPSHQISYYPILGLESESSYVGLELFNYGSVDRVGRNVLDGINVEINGSSTTVSMLFDFDAADEIDTGGDETFVEPGDSGGPSFVNWNGQLALLGVHWFQSKSEEEAWYSGDTFIPHYADVANSLMAGETLTIIPDPSPLAY